MRRRASGPTELEALDPRTGESLSASDDPASPGAETRRSDRGVDARATRLRRLALLSALLAVGCASAAGYFALSIAQLRAVERTWREAMALDAARSDADRQVRQQHADATSGADDEALLAPLGAIGTEVASGLRRYERALADRRILDSKVSDLRDAMVEALEFRRFQLSPTRDRIGDTPLRRVEAGISGQLDRWGLAPSRAEQPELDALGPALATLRRYADVETGAVLFALDGTTLHTIDVDDSTRREREVPFPGEAIGVSSGVAVLGEGRLAVYAAARPDAEPVAAVDDVHDAVAAGDGSGDLWVVARGGTTVRRYRIGGAAPGWATDPLTLPPGRVVTGSTFDHLVLATPEGGLELWSPSSPFEQTMLAPRDARFLAAEGALVLFQGPLPYNSNGGSNFLHRVDARTGRRDLIGLPRTDAAAASLSRSGVAAVSAGPLAGRLGSLLFLAPDSTALTGAGAGPRASVEAGTIVWAGDGDTVFWLTPDGAIAIAHGDRPIARQVLRTELDGLDRLAVMGR